MKTLQEMIASDPSVAPAFAQAFRVVREPCWACSGGMRPPAYGPCATCGGKNLIVTERRQA